MKVLVHLDTAIQSFEQCDDRLVNEYIWRFYEDGLRGAISDWLTSSKNLSYGGLTRHARPTTCGLSDHLVLCYDTWVEQHGASTGTTGYEYNKDITRLDLIGQLLEDYLNSFIYRYFKKDLQEIEIKRCQWVTPTSVILEVSL